jgi:hypothetical protein
MKYNGKPNLGGTGEIHSYLDELGDEWLFKPAQSKSGNPETSGHTSRRQDIKSRA